MQDFRTQVAELWQISARLSRLDIFGPDDPLCPRYRRNDLNWQIDVVAPGFVGANYRSGGLVILSVKPAGGEEDFFSDPKSDAVYESFMELRDSENPLEVFEESNRAVLRSISQWGAVARACDRILTAVDKVYDDIAFLYVVPFRTRSDSASSVKKTYLENGYSKHLKRQLGLLFPGHIVAIYKDSKEAAEKFREDCNPGVDVFYYTGERNRSGERKRKLMLERLSKICSQ